MLGLYIDSGDGDKSSTILSMMEKRNLVPPETVFFNVINKNMEAPDHFLF